MCVIISMLMIFNYIVSSNLLNITKLSSLINCVGNIKERICDHFLQINCDKIETLITAQIAEINSKPILGILTSSDKPNLRNFGISFDSAMSLQCYSYTSETFF